MKIISIALRFDDVDQIDEKVYQLVHSNATKHGYTIVEEDDIASFSADDVLRDFVASKNGNEFVCEVDLEDMVVSIVPLEPVVEKTGLFASAKQIDLSFYITAALALCDQCAIEKLTIEEEE